MFKGRNKQVRLLPAVPHLGNVWHCPIFTTHEMELMVPASSAEVSGVLVEAVVIFQEHFLLLTLSSGSKLYFLMVGVKVLCRIKSAFFKCSAFPLCWVLHVMRLYA